MVKQWNWLKVGKNIAKVGLSLMAAGNITSNPELAALLTLLFTLILNTIEFFDKQGDA